MKLKQEQFLKGSREFEVVDNVVFVRIKSLLREEKLTIDLTTLNPDPVTTDAEVIFYSNQHQRPVLSLLLNRPDTGEFNRFVNMLIRIIRGEVYTGASEQQARVETSRPEAPGWNVYDEPPEFDEPGKKREKGSHKPVIPRGVEQDISMLKTYMNPADISVLLDALEALRLDPENDLVFEQLVDTFNQLGFNQGAVLTYAPYLKVLLSRYGCF